MSTNEMERLDKEIKIISYLDDTILSNQWKEYNKIHEMVMRSELNKDEYLELCDKLRDLEDRIQRTLSERAKAANRIRMYRNAKERSDRLKNR